MHIMRWSPQHTPEQVKSLADTPVGRHVTIVTRRNRIGDIEYHHYTTVEDLRRLGVTSILECEYKEINENGITVIKDGKEINLEADTIVTSNYEPDDRLYHELTDKVSELYLIGDARAVQVQFISNIHSAYRLALTI